MLESKGKDFNWEFAEYLNENKFILLFVNEEITNALLNSQIHKIDLVSIAWDYCVNIYLTEPFQDFVISNHYSFSKFKCTVRNRHGVISDGTDEEWLTKLFSKFDWLEIHKEMCNKNIFLKKLQFFLTFKQN